MPFRLPARRVPLKILQPNESLVTWPDLGPGFYLLAVVAIAITGISKGGFGSGIGGVQCRCSLCR